MVAWLFEEDMLKQFNSNTPNVTEVPSTIGPTIRFNPPPNEGPNNPANFRRLPEAQRTNILRWIALAVKKAKTRDPRMNSYGLKHELEREVGLYCNNGSMKGAMIEAGFPPVSEDDLNWQFCCRPTRRRPHLARRPDGSGDQNRRFLNGVGHLPEDQLSEFRRDKAAATLPGEEASQGDN